MSAHNRIKGRSENQRVRAPTITADLQQATDDIRRFMTDLRDAESKGFIAHAPHYNSLSRCLDSEAVTPIIQDSILGAAVPLGRSKPTSRLIRRDLPGLNLSDSGRKKSTALKRCAENTTGLRFRRSAA
jgi:hypothetical protein